MNQPMIALLLCVSSVRAAQVAAVVPVTTNVTTPGVLQTGSAQTNSEGTPSTTAQVAAAESAVEQITTTTDTADPMESFLERLRQFQSFGTEDGQISFNADLWLTLDYMVFSTPPPGFIQTSNGQIFAPTLSGLFTLDISKHLEFVFLGLVNRGFDPTETSVQSQPAEYYTQLTPFDTPVLNFKGGKFQTAFGQWTNRHFSTQNSLINAPMMYGQMTSVTDGNGGASIAPTTSNLVRRKTSAVPVPPVTKWIPIVWGPSYASGFQLNGTVGTLQQLDWAFEMKNASLSSRPQEWDLWNRGFNYPTFTGRAGFRPDAAWNLGVSGSSGSYISQAAYDRFSTTSKPGSSIGESRQNVVGTDISYAHGPIELWSEFAWSQYEVPDAKDGKAVGNIGAYSYFIESKWKFMPQFWLSGRWNQQLYSNVTPATGPGAGSETSWYNNLWRADACLGFKINRFTQFKVQYSYTEEAGTIDPGQNLFAVELVIQF